MVQDLDLDYYFALIDTAISLWSRADKKPDFEKTLEGLKPKANMLSVVILNSISSGQDDFDYISFLAKLKRLFPDLIKLSPRRSLRQNRHSCDNYQKFRSKNDAVSFLKSNAGKKMIKHGGGKKLTSYYCSEHQCFHLKNKDKGF